jgi:hypothetical protein
MFGKSILGRVTDFEGWLQEVDLLSSLNVFLFCAASSAELGV